MSLDLLFSSLLIICLSQGREPAESQLYAEHDRGPNRVGPVVLRVPASPPTANLQIIFSGTVETRGHWSEDVHWCMCVRMYVYGVCVRKQWEADWRNASCSISSCGPPSLREKSSWAELKSNYVTDTARTESDKELILMRIWHFLPSWSNASEEEKKKKKARNPRSWLYMSMIEWISVYSHRTMLSCWGIVQIQSRQTDVWSVFVQKAQSSLLKTSQMYVCVCMLKTRFMRMFSMFALKDCYWVSPGVFVYRTPEL